MFPIDYHCPAFERRPFNQMCRGPNRIAMHVTHDYSDLDACQTNCSNKGWELGQDGCCEARNTHGYCVFYPGGERIAGHNDAKAVLCKNFVTL